MEQRQHAEIDVTLAQAPRLHQRTLRSQKVGLRQQCAARPAADGGGMNNDKAIVRAEIAFRYRGIGGRKLGEWHKRPSLIADAEIAPHRGERSSQRCNDLLIFRTDDHQHRRAVGQHVADFLGVKAEINRQQNRAEPRCRADQINHFQRVLRQDRDAVARFDTLVGKAGGQPLDPSEIVTMGDALAFEHEGGAVGKQLRVASVDILEREIPGCHR